MTALHIGSTSDQTFGIIKIQAGKMIHSPPPPPRRLEFAEKREKQSQSTQKAIQMWFNPSVNNIWQF